MKNTTLNSRFPTTHLRVYRGPAESSAPVPGDENTVDEDTVTVAVGDRRRDRQRANLADRFRARRHHDFA